jgi:hypothetical protein
VNKIKLHYDPYPTNFGDLLSIFIAEKLYGAIASASTYDCDAVFVGSLINRFFRKRSFPSRAAGLLRPPVKIWGAGFIEKEHGIGEKLFRRLEIYACRGYRTLERLKKVRGVKFKREIAVADPGLLSGRLIDTSNIKKKYKLGIIPHYIDKNSPFLSKIMVENSTFINIQQDPETFMKLLAECELVIASAMHALIAADSLGMPNIRMILSDKIIGGDYKYDDYYSAFSLSSHAKIDLQKRDFSDKDLHEIRENYKIDQEKVKKLQDELIATFPFKDRR